MTTGGPDTSDVYEEEVQDGKYKFRGEWRPLETRHEKIGVKVGDKIDWKDVTIESTVHGPIVAHKNGKSYSVAIPYADEVRLMDESWGMVTAHNLAEMKKALAMLQLMAQNIMVGTVDGDIYYVRNGRVPVRPKGCDPSKPMPGASGACEWQGLHPFRGPGADHQSAAGIHAELQRLAVRHDEGFAAGAGRVRGASVSLQRTAHAAASARRHGAGPAGCRARCDRGTSYRHRVFAAGVARGAVAGAHPQGGARRASSHRMLAGMEPPQRRGFAGALAFYLFQDDARNGAARARVDPPADL